MGKIRVIQRRHIKQIPPELTSRNMKIGKSLPEMVIEKNQASNLEIISGSENS
jgi:hypothetical protein